MNDSEQRLRAIFDGTREYLGLLTPDGTLIEANRASLSFAGSKREDVVGRPFWETIWFRFTPGAPEEIRAAITRAASGELVRFESRIITPTGETKVFALSLDPIRDEDGNVILIVPEGRDITDQKKAEEALRRSEERLRLATDAAGLGIWAWDIPEDHVTWENDWPSEFFGNSRSEGPINSARFRAEFLHPDDATKFEAEIAAALHTGRRFFFVGRVRRSNGEIRWVEFTGKSTEDHAGTVTKLLGTVTDVTERKRAEEALQESGERFRAMADAMPQLAWTARADGFIHWYNRGWYEYTGTTPQAMEGWGERA